MYHLDAIMTMVGDIVILPARVTTRDIDVVSVYLKKCNRTWGSGQDALISDQLKVH